MSASSKQLRLNRETVRELDPGDLGMAGAANSLICLTGTETWTNVCCLLASLNCPILTGTETANTYCAC